MKGLDGIQGPIYVGTGCVFRRRALYGYDAPKTKKPPGKTCNCWPKWCCLFCGSRKNKSKAKKDSSKKSKNREASSKQIHALENIEEGREESKPMKPSETSQAKLEKRFGQSPVFIAAALLEDGGVPRNASPASLLREAIQVISCGYEDKTDWGKEVGWIYGSVTEDILTGFKMHCHGWRSVYCIPKRPAFKGSAPINLSDRLHQVLRWALGSVEIFFSRHCPIWYGYGGGLKWLERFSYINSVVYPWTSIPLLVYCTLPAILLPSLLRCFLLSSSLLPVSPKISTSQVPTTPMAASSTFTNAASMAESCFLSSLSLFTTPRTPLLSLSIPSRPLKLNLLSHSLSLKPTTITKFASLIPFVSQTSDWAQQDEQTASVADEEEDTPAAEESYDEEEDDEDDGFFPQVPSEDAKVFVGGLPFDVDSEKLAMLFEQAGTVEIAEVIYNRETDSSRGFGFVTMSSVEEAEKAIQMFNRYEIEGRTLTVNKAAARGTRPERVNRPTENAYTVYVGNVPWSVDDARLMEVFSEHGKVTNARVVYDRESGRSRGFAFVTMASEAEMNDVVAAMDGQSLDGRSLRVNVAENRARRSF